MPKFKDERGHRSDRYQEKFHEVPCTQDFLNSFDNSHGMEHHLNPYEYNEELLDLQDKLKNKFWDLAHRILTKRQDIVITMYADGYTQSEIAKFLNVNQSSVTKSINGNHDYKKDGKKVYGGLMKKLKIAIEKDEEIQKILARMSELKEERKG